MKLKMKPFYNVNSLETDTGYLNCRHRQSEPPRSGDIFFLLTETKQVPHFIGRKTEAPALLKVHVSISAKEHERVKKKK